MQTVCELKVVCKHNVRLNAALSHMFSSRIVQSYIHVLKGMCGEADFFFFVLGLTGLASETSVFGIIYRNQVCQCFFCFLRVSCFTELDCNNRLLATFFC